MPPRTKADAYSKAGGKASRKSSISKPLAKSIKIKKSKSGSLNKPIKRPTPKWQSPITKFFTKDGKEVEEITDKVHDADPEIFEESTNGENFDEPSCSKKIEESTNGDEAENSIDEVN
ncbi:uncharacterized protein [Parasteatoda tepidariorum]|uniref:uncharacterized protein isoform X2 n=1 Tax=Parasteatoda tepidariorum TaxID=114398 RepID=UPI00077FC59C|nr:uncharacterized protein LOC107443156 isoform X2 [Parasteatoda tepidariorum]